MKGMARCVLSLGVVMGLGAVHAAQAPARVSRVYTDTVAPADQQAYLAGIKSYNKCLADHGFKYKWTALDHETGDVYSYSYVSDPGTWAAFDDMHKQGKACDATFQSAVNPHLKGETSAFIEEQAEMSHTEAKNGASGNLLQVTYFKLKHVPGSRMAFTDAAKKIAAAAAKSHWPYYYRFVRVRDGGADAPDFMVTSYATDWANFGTDASPTLWKMVESADGKDAADALRKVLGEAIEQQSSHVDSVDAELTYTPSAH